MNIVKYILYSRKLYSTTYKLLLGDFVTEKSIIYCECCDSEATDGSIEPMRAAVSGASDSLCLKNKNQNSPVPRNGVPANKASQSR